MDGKTLSRSSLDGETYLITNTEKPSPRVYWFLSSPITKLNKLIKSNTKLVVRTYLYNNMLISCNLQYTIGRYPKHFTLYLL